METEKNSQIIATCEQQKTTSEKASVCSKTVASLKFKIRVKKNLCHKTTRFFALLPVST